MDAIAGLRDKVDGVGLLDSIMNRRLQRAYNLTYSLDGRSSGGSSTLPPGPGSEKYRGLRGRPAGMAAAHGQSAPAMVPREPPTASLSAADPMNAEAAQMDRDMMLLIGQARKIRASDPARASRLLEQAGAPIGKMEPQQRRAVALQQIMSAYREIEGKPSSDLVKAGFGVLARLAELEKNRARPNLVALGAVSRSYGSGAIDLEASLVADLSMYSFDEAMRYVRNMPEAQRLIVLVRIIQTLSPL